MADKVEIKNRKEGEVIPLGVSCTKTDSFWYLRIRPQKNTIITVKVSKVSYEVSSRFEIHDDNDFYESK